MRRVFICFLEEIEDTKKTFRNYLTFSIANFVDLWLRWLQMILNDYKWLFRDVSTGATGATAVAPKFSDTLTLSQPGGTDSAHHCGGRT